jgi:KAP family P-loop domain
VKAMTNETSDRKITDLQEIKNLIQKHNPFTNQVTSQHQVWSNDYFGVETINQNAFDQILSIIDQVETNKLENNESQLEGAFIIGERGLGKTQLIARLHHYLHANGQAFFVYMNEYENLDLIDSEALQALVYSLRRESITKVTQWQILAAEMFFDARGERKHTIEQVVKQSLVLFKQNAKKINEWTFAISQKVAHIKNMYVIRAIILTLVPQCVSFALMWLSGKKLTEESARILGLPTEWEGNALDHINDLLCLITRYRKVVFCFDELDTPAISSQMLTTAQIVTSLAKIPTFYNQPIVFLLAMFPKTHRDEIHDCKDSPMVSTIKAAEERIKYKIELGELDFTASLALIENRLQSFYNHHNVTPPHSFYPFRKEYLVKTFSSGTAIARRVLRWSEEHWYSPIAIDLDPPPWQPVLPIAEPVAPVDHTNSDSSSDANPPIAVVPEPTAPKSIAQEYYEEHLQDTYSDIDRLEANLLDDAEKITQMLRFAFERLVKTEQVVAEMRVFGVIEEQDKTYKEIVPFKVKIRKADKPNGHYAFVGIAVIQKTGLSLTSNLGKLVKFNQQNKTRACLIRSEDISGNVARKHALNIIENGGEWIKFETKHIVQILALMTCLRKLKQDSEANLTEADIWEYIDHANILTDNPLIQEILSKPNQQIPKNFTLADLENLASQL